VGGALHELAQPAGVHSCAPPIGPGLHDVDSRGDYQTPKRAVDPGQPYRYGLVALSPFAFTD